MKLEIRNKIWLKKLLEKIHLEDREGEREGGINMIKIGLNVNSIRRKVN
jgi:hypothetical protein